MTSVLKIMFVAIAVFSLTAAPGMITDAHAKGNTGLTTKK